MPESDDARTLYAAITTLTNSLKPVIEGVPLILGGLTNLDNRLTALETIANEILNTQLNIVTTVDNTAEVVVSIGERTSRTYNLVDDTSKAVGDAVSEVDRKVSTVQESVPDLNSGMTVLLENAVPATAVAGKIDVLQESHDNILIIAQTVKEEVTPLLDALQGSPVLKMLGVKS